METLLPLMLDLTRQHQLGLSQAIAALTQKPAAVLGFDSGALTPGFPADICIFDPQANWKVDKQNWLSTGQNTPYWGETLQGRVTHTLLAGQIIYAFSG